MKSQKSYVFHAFVPFFLWQMSEKDLSLYTFSAYKTKNRIGTNYSMTP